jgi:hypothetical protein
MSDTIIINTNPPVQDSIIINVSPSVSDSINIDTNSNVISVNGKYGVVILDKCDIGLCNVDDTSDLNKPLSNATISALYLKVDMADFLTLRSLVTSNSSNWDSVYSNVLTNSSRWEYAYNTVIGGLSSNLWNNVYTSFASQSANNVSVYNSVKALSGNWNNSYNWVNTNSSNAIFNTISAGSLSGVFYGDGSNLIGASLPGQANINTLVRSNSGQWDSVYTIVNTNSAVNWNYQGTDLKALSGGWQSTSNVFQNQSANNISVYNIVNSNSAVNWNYQGTDIKSLTGEWVGGNKAYTNLTLLSTIYESVTSVNGTIYQINAVNTNGNVILSLPNSIIVPGDLNVSGTLFVQGSSYTVNTQNVEVNDPLIYIGTGNIGNLNDLGFVGHFNDGLYQHTGLVRNHLINEWSLFSGVTSEPLSSINWNDPTFKFDTLNANIKGTLIGNVTGNISGNASSVTSGVYTNISYSDPSWIVNLSDSKIIGTNRNNWDSVYSYVNSSSSQEIKQQAVVSFVNSNSSNIVNVDTLVNITSANWNSVYSNVNGLSGNWNSVYSNANGLSANWNSSYSSVNGLSGNWNSVYSNVNTTSANWNSSYSSVNGLSANWSNSYTWISSNSARATFTTSISAPSLSGTFYGDGSKLTGIVSPVGIYLPLSGGTLTGDLTTTGVVYASSGNSNIWNIAYNTSTAYQSASSGFVTNVTLHSLTGTFLPISIYQNASSNWQSTYSTVSLLSSTWSTGVSGGGSGNPAVNSLVISNSAFWNTAYAYSTVFSQNSSVYNNTTTTVAANSALWGMGLAPYGELTSALFTGDGFTNTFNLSSTSPFTNSAGYIVSMNGSLQVPDLDYTIIYSSGTNKVVTNFIPRYGSSLSVITLSNKPIPNSITTLVNTTSANWNSVYSYVNSTSATNNPDYNSSIFAKLSSTSGGGGGLTYEIKNSNFNAIATKQYLVDTSLNVVVGTLPPSPSIGDAIDFEDASGTWNSKPFILNNNGNLIESFNESLTANINSYKFKTIFIGGIYGWRLF